MKYDPNDPKLTAYALGELDETETAEMEELLSLSEEARLHVESIRSTAEMLVEEFRNEPAPVLGSPQRESVEQQLAKGNDRGRVKTLPGWSKRQLTVWRIAAVTVPFIVLIAIIVPNLVRPRVQYAQVSAEKHNARIRDLKVRLLADSEKGESSDQWFFDRVDTQWMTDGDETFAWDSSDYSTEAYDQIVDNSFLWVPQNPLSTFSIDVDTASYSNVRRFLRDGSLPPKGAVRIEEMINYFSYDYAPPTGPEPFSAHIEIAGCPWNQKHRLIRIGLKGKTFETQDQPASNLVFLLDVSGSMDQPNKLPLLKSALTVLARQLSAKDHVAIVVYAGASGLALPSTPGDNQRAIVWAIHQLQSGGSTQGSAGIQLAYEVAAANFIQGGINRVILATDGDFNVGITNQSDLTDLIEEKAKTGVFLTVLGFGMGNLKDSTLEKLADKGNGNYAYIDTLNEARKVLVEEMSGTLVTIAKDVKIQVEWNPALVSAFRLIGYENRILRHEDFDDDTKDAGEIGAGHTVTALYEILPFGEEIDFPVTDPLKYQQDIKLSEAAVSGELMTLKIRYKEPDGDTSSLLEFPVTDEGRGYEEASDDFKFATAVAAFGMILRDSKYRGTANLDTVLELAGEGKGIDEHGYRLEFIELVKAAQSLVGRP